MVSDYSNGGNGFSAPEHAPNSGSGALVDSLTGLPNREAFDIRISNLVNTHSGRFGLILFDIDGLKFTNDTKGHTAGDALIQEAAAIAHSSLRILSDGRVPDEIGTGTFRLAGDEFTLLLPGVTDKNGIETIIDRAEAALLDKGIEASFGGKVHEPSETDKQLIMAVDQLMYRKKEERKEAKIQALPLRKRAAYRAGQLLTKYSGIYTR